MEAMECKLDLYKDCLKTGSVKIQEGSKDDDEKCTWLNLSPQGNSNTSRPSGQGTVE